MRHCSKDCWQTLHMFLEAILPPKIPPPERRVFQKGQHITTYCNAAMKYLKASHFGPWNTLFWLGTFPLNVRLPQTFLLPLSVCNVFQQTIIYSTLPNHILSQETSTSNTQKTDHQKCTHENAKNVHPSMGETCSKPGQSVMQRLEKGWVFCQPWNINHREWFPQIMFAKIQQSWHVT